MMRDIAIILEMFDKATLVLSQNTSTIHLVIQIK